MALRIVPSHAVPSRIFPRASPSRIVHPNLHPVLLYDAVTIQSGGEQAFRSEAFTNNLGRAIEIHGMRVVIELAAGSVIQGGGIIALNIAADKAPMTRGAIPVWGICRSDNRASFSGFDQLGVSAFAWYFSQPMPLAAGKSITVEAKHLGVDANAATVRVAFVGRIAGEPIAKRIPYVVQWSSLAFAYATAGTDTSPPAALANDTKRDFHVDRIIGRSVAFDDTSGAVQSYVDYDDVSLQGETSLSLRLGTAQARSILQTYTPWRTVFGQNAAVETDFILAPGDYLIADVRHAAGPVLGAPFTYSQNHGEISLVGWREE